MKKFLTSINWQSKAGNPMVTIKEVTAKDEDSAIKSLSNRVKKYKRFSKIQGGDCVPA
jgi:hypothetical protein